MSSLKVSVTDFGAVSDSPNLQTKAFQDAIDYCFSNGGGEVIVPAGNYIIGDIRLRSNMTFHLLENAVLMGSRNPKDYLNIYDDKVEPLTKEEATRTPMTPMHILRQLGVEWQVYRHRLFECGSYWNYGMIKAIHAENINIIGEKGAVIDGRNVYDSMGEEGYRGPHTINMHYCKNIKFSGYTIINSSNWAHCIFRSEDLYFDNLTILAGHDGIHTRICKDVTITNCKIETGDDSIAGFDALDVVVKNCDISSACSAFRFGGNNILVEDCNIYGPCKYPMRGAFILDDKKCGSDCSPTAKPQMLGFFTYFVQSDFEEPRRAPGKIVIRNCTVKNMERFFHLNLSGNEPWQKGNPLTDITFENVKAEGLTAGVNAHGNGVVPFKIIFKNFDYTIPEGSETKSFMRLSKFGSIIFDGANIHNFKGDTFIKAWDDTGEIIFKNFTCDAEKDQLVVKTDEPLTCNAI